MASVTILSPALAGFSKSSPSPNGLKNRRGEGALNRHNKGTMWMARMPVVSAHPAVESNSQPHSPAENRAYAPHIEKQRLSVNTRRGCIAFALQTSFLLIFFFIYCESFPVISLGELLTDHPLRLAFSTFALQSSWVTEQRSL